MMLKVLNSKGWYGFGKYAGLIVSISVLVISIITVLSVTLVLSNSIKKAGATTTIVSRQSTLINQIAKDLFIINARYQQQLPIVNEKNQLREDMYIFESTLDAVSHGAESVTYQITKIVHGVAIEPFVGNNSDLLLYEANLLWSWYRKGVDPILQSSNYQSDEIINAHGISEKYTERLSHLMEQASNQMQAQYTKNINYLQIAQFLGIIFTVLMLCWTVFVTFKNLRKNDKALNKAVDETRGILNTVREGLFLLDNNLNIGGQYSREVVEIFDTKDIAGRAFTDLLEKRVDENNMGVIKEFVSLLFDADKIEELIETLNPLDCLEMNILDDNGKNKTKYLSFVFYRVMQGGSISSVLVSIKDITDKILLEKELDSSKNQDNRQVEMLVSFLKLDPNMLNGFLIESRKSLELINRVLKRPVNSQVDFKSKANEIYVEVHRIKGEAASMKFDEIVQRLHAFEDDMNVIQANDKPEGLDFLPFVVQLDSLISYIDDLIVLSRKINMKSVDIVRQNSVLEKEDWSYLSLMVERVARQENKKVDLIISSSSIKQLNQRYKNMINTIASQLIRNALAHGIEFPHKRLAVGKSERGRIDFRLVELPDGKLELTLRDDGRGFDLNLIRSRIVEQGVATESDLLNWSAMDVLAAVFRTGFSTSHDAGLNAGRGVGLDVIRKTVKRYRGTIKVYQREHRFCQFEIIFPPLQID